MGFFVFVLFSDSKEDAGTRKRCDENAELYMSAVKKKQRKKGVGGGGGGLKEEEERSSQPPI